MRSSAVSSRSAGIGQVMRSGDVFVHVLAAQGSGLDAIHEGDRLKYELELDQRGGKMRAAAEGVEVMRRGYCEGRDHGIGACPEGNVFGRRLASRTRRPSELNAGLLLFLTPLVRALGLSQFWRRGSWLLWRFFGAKIIAGRRGGKATTGCESG